MSEQTGAQVQNQAAGQPGAGPKREIQPNDNWVDIIPARGAFDDAACDQVLALFQELKSGEIGPEELGKGHRNSHIAWLDLTPETQWLHDRVKHVMLEANKRYFHFDLAGFAEPLQLTEYGAGQFYDWHADIGAGRASLRKLSFIVQLSRPEDYEGGDFEIMNSRDAQPMPRDRGIVLIFPSFLLHRVAPVTSGTRRSLVGWVGGPPFR